jgi:hypothetical protein
MASRVKVSATFVPSAYDFPDNPTTTVANRGGKLCDRSSRLVLSQYAVL